MGVYIDKGNTRFADYTRGEYVDKTGMIAYINSTLNTADRLTCVTRPRRFGKSMAASMLCAYYDKSCDSTSLFNRFAISHDPSYKEHLNMYSVLFLDVTNFVSEYRGKKDIVKRIHKAIKADVISAFPDVQIPKNAHLMSALQAIATQKKQKFIFMIDEWDALCRELADKPEIMDEYVDFLRRLFKSNETATVFAGVYMTGILPIKKYGTQSALNDFREYSMTKPGAMGGFLGFNDSDVKMLADKYGMDFLELKRWYDGYEMDTFDWRQNIPEIKKTAIYNPNSVMTAVRERHCDNYWATTEAFESLQQYIDCNFNGVQETLENLINGKAVRLNILRYGNDITTLTGNEELFTMLIHFGYLSYDRNDRVAVLPNQEIREEFIEALRGSRSHKELSELVRRSDKLLKAMWQKEEETVAEGVEYIHNHKVAPNFYNNEQALRSVVRMAFLGAIDYYIEIQELASGKGYADVVFIPRRNSSSPLIVIELKWNKTADSAITQIKDRQYPGVFQEYSGDILLVGISYDEKTKKHTCKIEKY